MRPETKYVEGSGEALIAYQVIGSEPLDLVYMRGPASVDMGWDHPGLVQFYERLSSFSRLIMFDRRGLGVSDAIPIDQLPTWEEWADDLRVVLDAVGSERAAIFAIVDAGPMAILFAATQPGRITSLILGNTAARVLVDEDYPAGITREAAEEFVKLFREQWGTESLAAVLAPSMAGDQGFRTWYAAWMRASASPRVASALARNFIETDVRAALASVHVPTLVLQRTSPQLGPPELGRYLAEHIAGARFVEIPGADVTPFTDHRDVILDAIEEFLTGSSHAREPDRVLATMLFTDIVGSTARAADIGDQRWRTVLDEHDAVMRREIDRFRGRLVKSMGDGVLATFDGPARAIRCALALSDAVRPLGIEVRTGLHTGEVEVRGDDVGGIAVHIAERVMGEAGAGEVVVSSSVPPLVAGSGLEFEDGGVRALKGVPGEWRLYSVKK